MIIYTKTCSSCKVELPTTDYNKQSRSHDGFQAYCRLCSKTKNAERWKNTPEKIRVNTDRWFRDNSERATELARGYRHRNPDAVKQSCKRYQQNNMGKCIAHNAKYQASKIKATPKWLTKTQIDEMKAIYIDANNRGLQVDHIVPLRGQNVCGLHVPWNLEPLTKSENCKKGNRFDGAH